MRWPRVDVLHNSAEDGFAQELAAHIAQLSIALDNPERILQNAAKWAEENFEKAVYSNYWVTLTRSHVCDRGLALDVATLPWAVRMRRRLGSGSGYGVHTPDYRISGSIRASMGIGLVAQLDNWQKVSPVAAFAIHF